MSYRAVIVEKKGKGLQSKEGTRNDILANDYHRQLIDPHKVIAEKPSSRNKEFSITQEIRYVCETELPIEIVQDIFALCSYFERVGKQEGYFDKDSKPEFRILYSNTHSIEVAHGGHVLGQELIFLSFPLQALAFPGARLFHLSILFHEMRHRVGRSHLASLQNEKGHYLAPHAALSKATHHSVGFTILEELYTIMYTARDFKNFMKETKHPLLKLYERFEQKGESIAQSKNGAFNDTYPGIGTLAYSTDLNVSPTSNTIPLSLHPYESFFYLAHEISKDIPNFFTLLDSARKETTGALGELSRAIIQKYDKRMLKALLSLTRATHESFAVCDSITAAIRAMRKK